MESGAAEECHEMGGLRRAESSFLERCMAGDKDDDRGGEGRCG